MTIGVPVEIDNLSIITTVTDYEEKFQPVKYQGYSKGKRYRELENVYEFTGDTPVIQNYSPNTLYPAGKVLYGNPDWLGHNSLLITFDAGGKRNLDPEDYVYDDGVAFDTSLDFKQWTKRYVKMPKSNAVNIQGATKYTFSQGNITWEVYYNYTYYCEVRIRYGGDKVLMFENIPIQWRVSNKAEDIAEIFYTDSTNTNGFFIPKCIVIGRDGWYIRTNQDKDIQTESISTDSDVTPLTSIKDVSGFEYIEKTNSRKPFDKKNYSAATANGSMRYSFRAKSKFNSIALAGVLADTITINVKNSSGSIIHTYTRDVIANRDVDGILDPYPATEIFYATKTDVPIYSNTDTVEIILIGDYVELGNILLTQAIDAGFTNLELSNTYKDYSTIKYDPWGNADYVERAKVSSYTATVDVPIYNYDMTDRLMKSLGKKVIVIDGADNTDETKDNVFTSTQKIGRITSYSLQNNIKGNSIGDYATYSLAFEEIV